MRDCIDKSLGTLLPAYELGALSKDDEKRLEIHLMQCEYCMNRALAFKTFAEALRGSTKIKEAIARHAKSTEDAGIRGKLIRYLWPDAPLIFKPALYILLVLLMVGPTIIGLQIITRDSGNARPVQMIRLVPIRAFMTNTLSMGVGLDAIVSFAVPDYSPGKYYDIVIADERGRELVHLESFSSIDERGMGQIIIPGRVMKPGSYQLIIACSPADSTTCELKYAFEIIP